MLRMILFFLAVSLPFTAFAQGNISNDSYNKAKKALELQVYNDHRTTIYCGAKFDVRKKIEPAQDFKTPSGYGARARRMEWEHAVPAENFGRYFIEWREGHPQCVDNNGNSFKGRNCASKMNMRYRLMQADMHNLFPSIGAVNSVRSNKRYTRLTDADDDFGPSCPGVRYSQNGFEPPDKSKGILARTALYMDANYPEYNLSRQQKRLFEAWDKDYPVDAWECERERRIAKIQGNANDVTRSRCAKAGL